MTQERLIELIAAETKGSALLGMGRRNILTSKRSRKRTPRELRSLRSKIKPSDTWKIMCDARIW